MEISLFVIRFSIIDNLLSSWKIARSRSIPGGANDASDANDTDNADSPDDTNYTDDTDPDDTEDPSESSIIARRNSGWHPRGKDRPLKEK